MPLRPLPYRQVERRLKAAGFVPVASHGSHVKFLRESSSGSRTVVVPRHREIAVGTLRSIVRQAGLTIEEFEALGR
jgi:predicted RNA binding protein YcfA (HicA-like mRNA interferase family)